MKKVIIPITLIALIMTTACYYIVTDLNNTPKQEEIAQENSIDEKLIKEDTAIVIYSNKDEKILNFQSIPSGERYALHISGTTDLSDQYGEVLSLEQVSIGEIVDVVYSVHNKTIRSIQVSSNTWTYSDISNFSFDHNRKAMSIGDEQYMYVDNVVIASGGEIVEMIDINESDILTIKGYNRVITSIIIEKGHGYLRLQNDEYFVGGWIEIGQEMIKPIKSEMLLAVPEGAYKVLVSHKGNVGEIDVKIDRDKETKVDLSEIEIKEVQKGVLAFNIIPSYATLMIDNENYDYLETIEMEYGVHQLIISAPGYKAISNFIKVGAPLANIEIELEEEGIASSTSNSTSSSSTNQSSSSTSYSYSFSSSSSSSSITTSETVINASEVKIFVDGPEGAEIYLDGSYMGIAPISFTKVTGSHAIILRKDGYQTKSYTVFIDNDEKNVTFSFSELLEGSSE